MSIEVFDRYEKKYRIRQDVYVELRKRLEQYMEADKHSKDGGFYTICNIYYDTDQNDLIRTSIEGKVYKEKLRLRSYGVVTPDSNVYLEIKKKYKKRVNKRRTVLKLAEAYEYVRTEQKPEAKTYVGKQVLSEIDYFLHRMDLKPRVFLAYDRCALFGKEDKNFRMTFDRNIITRRYDLGLEYGVYGEKLLEDDEWIMEVKIDKAMPLWMTKILSELHIYPTSFSKYGTEYKKFLANKKDENVAEEVQISAYG